MGGFPGRKMWNIALRSRNPIMLLKHIKAQDFANCTKQDLWTMPPPPKASTGKETASLNHLFLPCLLPCPYSLKLCPRHGAARVAAYKTCSRRSACGKWKLVGGPRYGDLWSTWCSLPLSLSIDLAFFNQFWRSSISRWSCLSSFFVLLHLNVSTLFLSFAQWFCCATVPQQYSQAFSSVWRSRWKSAIGKGLGRT